MDFDPQSQAAGRLIIAAACGGLVRLFLRPAKSIRQGVMLLCSCIICGAFGGPLLADLWPWWHGHADAAAAICAVLGLSLVHGALKAADKLDLSGLLAKFTQ